MNETEFASTFAAITGNLPFPWQWELYQRFLTGAFPASCKLPTGLGKTSVIHIWLLALAHAPQMVPRRLVYVVNRRTVVDQSTDEARRLRERIGAVRGLRERLKKLCAYSDPKDVPLAISTLRGQFADNREWSSDPARPAVIAGTVDMIGSRLLFSGYGCGFKSRPLHAGFLGQDSLLVHDEAHLEPAFQNLLTAIEEEQRSGRKPDFRPMRVMELTATSRTGGNSAFGLTDKDLKNKVVAQRMRAKKGIAFHGVAEHKKILDTVAELALKHKDSGKAILIFLASLEGVKRVEERLRKAKQQVQVLTGTIRGFERDNLPKKPVFLRFLPESNRPEGSEPQVGTIYLICTSAGEVGVNLSADHMVCDLTSFESMAQRLGRVNRIGFGDALIDVVHPNGFDTKDDSREVTRERTLGLLRTLPQREDGRFDACPEALGNLPQAEQQAAFSPKPTVLPTSAILFDTWALTSIQEPLPGRPRVEPYLHGLADGEPPETQVAWRSDVKLLETSGLTDKALGELLEDYPLKPHELLRDRSDRVFKHLSELAEVHAEKTVWLVDDYGNLETWRLGRLLEDRERINHHTIVLPESVGGLTQAGMLGHTDPAAQLDVADEWFGESEGNKVQLRCRTMVAEGSELKLPREMRRVAAVLIVPPSEEDEQSDNQDGEVTESVRRVLLFAVRSRSADDDGSKSAPEPIPLSSHHSKIEKDADRLAMRLLPEDLRPVAGVAAKFHDLGKARPIWQRSVGNTDLNQPLAKSGNHGPLLGLSGYRHEFGSLLDILAEPGFLALSEDCRELVLHIIATHHGSGRPHFVADAADQDKSEAECRRIFIEVPRRFARLQGKYGRWGLAWLESLLRAADAWASAHPKEDDP